MTEKSEMIKALLAAEAAPRPSAGPEATMKAASRCFGVYACCHVVLCVLQCFYGGFQSVGSLVVIAVAAALVWDNCLLALGGMLFPDAAKAHATFSRLAAWSQPRFYAHAFLTPLLAVQTTRLGARAGVSWLQEGSMIPTMVFVAALCLSVLGTLHHARSPSLVLRESHPKEPRNSWMRSIVSATLADKSPATLAWMILPAVFVCLWTCVVGASMARMYCELRSADLGFKSLAGPMGDVAGRWLWVCALVELLSNAGPPWVTALSGNAGEVVLLAGFVAAERELTSQGFMP